MLPLARAKFQQLGKEIVRSLSGKFWYLGACAVAVRPVANSALNLDKKPNMIAIALERFLTGLLFNFLGRTLAGKERHSSRKDSRSQENRAYEAHSCRTVNQERSPLSF